MLVSLVVPDASVLLKWTMESDDEEDRNCAIGLKESWLSGACQVLVPSLWVYEVGNILGLKRPGAAKELLQAMADLELEERQPATYLEDIYRLMNKYKVTFYDAAYHGLAIHAGGVFLTADAAYVRKTLAAGHIDELKGWRSPRS
jgi:predicted nucleic acid-binding protein